jgi:hypothetical protein
MELPFTIEEFLNVIKSYNQSIFPAQIIFYLVGFYCVYLLLKSPKHRDKFINFILSFFWLWIGIVYNLIFFTSINKAAYIFGFLFIIQGILFLIFGIVKNDISFSYRKDLFGIVGLIFISYALVIYPVLNFVLGHPYPYAPTFGLPCPTTIFTFGMLLFASKKISIGLLIIPLVWSLIGLSAAINLSIYEDFELIIAVVNSKFYQNFSISCC